MNARTNLRVGRVIARGRWRAPRLVIDQGDHLELATGSFLDGSFRPLRRYVDNKHIISWLPPIDPPLLLAIGLNYAEHCAEHCAATGGVPPPAQPLMFLKAISAVAGHDHAIRLPRRYPSEVDYEAELAVVIGRPCRRVAAADAWKHVAALTCANDVSARDVQHRIDAQWARAKSFDTFCPLGPWMVRPEAVDFKSGRIRSRVNGELRQDASLSDMIFGVPELIEFLSAGMTLPAGTVILTGTPAGVGAGFSPPRFLRDGDRVEIEVDGIGGLSNSVAFAEE